MLVEELVEAVTIFPDHLDLKVAGAPRLNVHLGEVGLEESANSGVGGGPAPQPHGLFVPRHTRWPRDAREAPPRCRNDSPTYIPNPK